MEVKKVLERFDIAYEDNGDGWAKVKCPFHDDQTPSASINLDNGAFKCFGCDHKADVFGFVAGTIRSSRAAVMALCEIPEDGDDTPDAVSADLVERWHQALVRNVKMLTLLEERKGLNLETVRRYRLGLAGDRVTMPVRAPDGVIVNVRQWSPTDVHRKVINLKGHGERRLYPVDALLDETIYITEGEMKALILRQHGFNAIAATGGASTWSKKWAEYFKDKIVVVIYDIDEAGRNGAAQVCHSIVTLAKSVKNVLLPIDPHEHPTGDITDWFTKCNQSADDLRRVIDDTPQWTPTPLITKLEDDTEVYPVSLHDSSQAKYFNKFVTLEAVASAKDTGPFIVPKKFQVSCLRDQEMCAVCPIFKRSEERPEVEIDCKDPVLLELVDIKTIFQHDVLKKAAGIPRKCGVCAFNTMETYNVEELRLIPQLKIASNTNEHVVRRAFHVGHGIETNVPYQITARCVPEPKAQYATLLIYESKSSVDSLSTFEVTDDVKSKLSIFQCEHTLEAVTTKLDHIYADLERNVTHIFKRRDMHLIYDLVYHSVLYVPFQGRTSKGWVEALVLGDSSQGKSETIKYLMQHYRLGEKVDAKNATIPGLLGGLQETARRWFISWGVITLNDRRLVCLEEIKGMSTEVIAKMTDARSSGVIELSKIEKARTTCRCRLIWISNPRSQRQLGTYNYGVEAIKELIGALEDVRRFDCAIVVASGDVPMSELNMPIDQRPAVEHVYTSELCRDLIVWTWSRPAEKVVFEPAAVDEVLAAASRLSEIFSSSIPLVESADQRLKLARLSAAVAARLFSTDDGTTLVVRRAHVQYIEKALQRIYSSPAFGYADYSKLVKGEGELDGAESIKRAITDLSHPLDTVRSMLDSNLITPADIMDWAACSYDEAKLLIGHLVRKRALKRYRSAYVKTPAFLQLLKELKDSGSLDRPEQPGRIKPPAPEGGDF